MKTQLSAFAISAMIITTAASPISQSLPDTKGAAKVKQVQSTSFAFFRTHRQGKGVTADWSVTSNSGISCFEVFRTYEDPTDPWAFWEDVSTVPCNSSRSYKSTENNVIPGFISYRIAAVMNDGSTILSDISTEHIH
jgi:hypothetical protein